MRTKPSAPSGRTAPAARLTELRIGISGWTYKPWRGVFYPAKLAHRRELEFASRTFGSIEINGSFYSLQLPSSYQRWHAETPADFVFSVKAPRFISHMKKLRDVEAPLANFFASGVFHLREKLGPILWQFPPNFGWNEERFRAFFELLPRDTGAALELARRHDAKVQGRTFLEIDDSRPLHYAVEIRHPTFLVPAFFALLREYNIAFVFADSAGKWPYVDELTADFVYIRLHGAQQLYVSGYTDAELDWWAERIRAWSEGKTKRRAYVYFDNDAKVHAPFDAARLAERLGLPPVVIARAHE